MKSLLWLNTQFSNKSLRKFFWISFSKCIHPFKSFASWNHLHFSNFFSRKISFQGNRFLKKLCKISKVGFSQVKFSTIFPGKCFFLKIHFQKEFLIILKNQNRFSNTSRLRFSEFQFPEFWFSFSKEFSYEFLIIFQRKFSKLEFSWQTFSLSIFIFSPRILSIFPGFSHILINFLMIFKILLSEFFWEIWFPSFALETLFQLQSIFSKHTSYFSTYILQSFIAHAWILYAFRIEHDFDNLTKSAHIWSLVRLPLLKAAGTVKPRTDRSSPILRNISRYFQNGGEYFKQFSKFWSSLTRGRFPLSPAGKGKFFATITGLATEMGPVIVWSKVFLT